MGSQSTHMSFVRPLLRGPVSLALRKATARATLPQQRAIWSMTRTAMTPGSIGPVAFIKPTAGASARACSSNAKSRAEETQRQNNTNIALWGATAAIVTLAASYLSVPLYRMFCQAYGYDLATQEESQERLKGLTPDERCAESAVVGMATYSVTPVQAGKHFKKVQCFCFEEQRLQVGEDVDMPVLFYMDPELLDDEQMDGVNDVTLSYTFFEAADSEGIDASVAAGATLGIRAPPPARMPARSNY